jgi:hypothetical protein
MVYEKVVAAGYEGRCSAPAWLAGVHMLHASSIKCSAVVLRRGAGGVDDSQCKCLNGSRVGLGQDERYAWTAKY